MTVPEKELKDIIRSILSSSRNISTIDSLQKDYLNLVGSKIPFHIFHYDSLELFLRNMPDVLQIKGTGLFAQCIPMSTKKSDHLNKMVKTKQMPPKPRKKSNRCSKYSLVYMQSNQRKFECELIEKKAKVNAMDQTYCSLDSYYENKSIPNEGNINKSKVEVQKSIICTNNVPELNKGYNIHDLNGTMEMFLKESLNDPNQLQDKSNVPKHVQDNLKILINNFDDGIWCSDLAQYYKKLFNRNIDYFQYGYSSLILMCMDLNDIFHIIRSGKDDLRLFDRNKPLPSTASTLTPVDINNSPLPNLGWSEFKFQIPKGIFCYGEEIPQAFFSTIAKKGDIFDVTVAEIYDPSKFWFYIRTYNSISYLDDLMDEMQIFYNISENKLHYGIPRELIKEGLYCTQIIYGEYHRAKIVKMLPESPDEVKAFFIDYGTVCRIPIKDMYFLHTKFAMLPGQAIRCRLANIEPKLNLHAWPRSSTDYFRTLVNQKNTKLKISYISWNEQFVYAFLADVTNKNKIETVNKLLVINGLAAWEDETTNMNKDCILLPNFESKVQKLHLFPTFLELEYGLAPNADELKLFEDLLTPLQFILPHYFKTKNKEQYEHQNEDVISSFIESIKSCRKYQSFNKPIEDNPINFNTFAGLKNDMVHFYNDLSSEHQEKSLNEADRFKNDVAEDFLKGDEKELLDIENLAILSKENVKLSSMIINELEMYNVQEDKASNSFDLTDDHLLEVFQPNYYDDKLKDNIIDISEQVKHVAGNGRTSPISPDSFLKLVDHLTITAPGNKEYASSSHGK